MLKTANSIILGNPFFVKHDISILPAKNILQVDDLTINEIKPQNEPRRVVRFKKIPFYTSKKQTIAVGEKIMIQCNLAKNTDDLESVSGVVTPNETLEQELDIAFTSSLSTVGKGNVIMISALNITDHDITIQQRTEVGKFSVLTPEQAEKLIQIDPQLIALARLKNSDATIAEINQVIEDETRRGKSQPSRPNPEYHKLWFPTPETCEDQKHSHHYRDKFMTKF